MVVTWEWFIIIGLIVGWVGMVVGKILFDATPYDTAACWVAFPCGILLLASVIFSVVLFSEQGVVEDKYTTYVETKTEYYYALLTDDTTDDVVAKSKVDEYNEWYSANKERLDNKWTLWGTTTCAKDFDYITEVN